MPAVPQAPAVSKKPKGALKINAAHLHAYTKKGKGLPNQKMTIGDMMERN